MVTIDGRGEQAEVSARVAVHAQTALGREDYVPLRSCPGTPPCADAPRSHATTGPTVTVLVLGTSQAGDCDFDFCVNDLAPV